MVDVAAPPLQMGRFESFHVYLLRRWMGRFESFHVVRASGRAMDPWKAVDLIGWKAMRGSDDTRLVRSKKAFSAGATRIRFTLTQRPGVRYHPDTLSHL
jgi:hypothetical protein